MSQTIKKCLQILAAFSSLVSGGFWAASAQAQMDLIQISVGASIEISKQLNQLSQYENFCAACAAAIAGISMFLMLLFEI